MTTTTSIAKREAQALSVENPPTLYAFNHQQMVKAQGDLKEWVSGKISSEKKALAEYQENLDVARRCKWRTSTLERIVQKTNKRLEFFQKMLLLVEAGYQIIPDLWMDNFAVRTSLKSPRARFVESSYGYHRVSKENAQHLPAGDGEYRNPVPTESREKEVERSEDGKERKIYTSIAESFREEIDFPFDLARVEILQETERALALKAFDEIGAIQQGGDPIIAGTIAGGGLRATFLIAWFVDLKDFK